MTTVQHTSSNMNLETSVYITSTQGQHFYHTLAGLNRRAILNSCPDRGLVTHGLIHMHTLEFKDHEYTVCIGLNRYFPTQCVRGVNIGQTSNPSWARKKFMEVFNTILLSNHNINLCSQRTLKTHILSYCHLCHKISHFICHFMPFYLWQILFMTKKSFYLWQICHAQFW